MYKNEKKGIKKVSIMEERKQLQRTISANKEKDERLI